MSEANPNRCEGGADRSGTDPVVRVEDLVVEFSTEKGRIRAVDGISFSVMPGEPVGIVGESGCGKTVTALSVLKLIPSPPGELRVVRSSWMARMSFPSGSVRCGGFVAMWPP